MDELIERLRREADISARPGQMDRLNALADEFAAALEAAQAERDAMREALKHADNELDLLDEDMDTCDHSVGVCTCSYWNMRRKMKAALAKESGND